MPPPDLQPKHFVETAPGSRAIAIAEIEAMGGAERSVLALCRFLYERGLAHHVVTYVDHVGLPTYAATPLRVVELKPPMRAHSKVAALRAYFGRSQASPKPLMSGYQPALHATLAGLRGFHCLMHDTPSLFEDSSPPTLQRRVARRISDLIVGFGLRSGGATIVTSEYLKEECRRVFGVGAHIARMGGLAGELEFRPRTVQGRLHMLSVSRLETNKRLDWMLRALAALENAPVALSQRADWTLRIVGRGSQAATLQTLAASLGMSERVHFHGFLSDAELEALYADAHLFLMPAVQGYGIPAIEAISRGIPVLLHRDSGVSDILLDTPWATVFAGGETKLQAALSEAIGSVLAGTHLTHEPPPIPNENQWAERVAALCGWL